MTFQYTVQGMKGASPQGFWPQNMRGHQYLVAGMVTHAEVGKRRTAFHESIPGTIEITRILTAVTCGGELWRSMDFKCIINRILVQKRLAN